MCVRVLKNFLYIPPLNSHNKNLILEPRDVAFCTRLMAKSLIARTIRFFCSGGPGCVVQEMSPSKWPYVVIHPESYREIIDPPHTTPPPPPF